MLALVLITINASVSGLRTSSVSLLSVSSSKSFFAHQPLYSSSGGVMASAKSSKRFALQPLYSVSSGVMDKLTMLNAEMLAVKEVRVQF